MTETARPALPLDFDHDWQRLPTLLDANNKHVAIVEKFHPAAREWAALIVRAVNAHAALVEAVRTYHETLSSHEIGDPHFAGFCVACDALALAEETAGGA